jgi:prepilin-type N-terminal cleavage/methylation domain-containing protein
MIKKFTLIELLVVVAILGILMSILMPSLSNARLKAQRAVCLSNLKNIYPAVMMYTDDNEDYLPWSQRRAGNLDPHVWWKRQTITYMGNFTTPTSTNYNQLYFEELGEGVFNCPSSKKNSLTGFKAGGYGWNLRYLGWGQTSTWAAGAPKRISASEIPEETMASGDASDDHSLPVWERLMFLSPSQRGLVGIGNRHFLGINRLFLDGHATFAKASSIQAGKDGDMDYFHKLDK